MGKLMVFVRVSTMIDGSMLTHPKTADKGQKSVSEKLPIR